MDSSALLSRGAECCFFFLLWLDSNLVLRFESLVFGGVGR